MKIILVVATSIDGKITMGDNPDVRVWTSDEDNLFFRSMIKQHNLIVMGRGVYDVMKGQMKHTPERLRVVITHHPEKYKAEEIPGQLEFTKHEPTRFMQSMARRGFKEMLLVSGKEVTTEFFKANLVDEIYLTLEPWLFGAGKPVVGDAELNKRLTLINVEAINTKGTLLLHYKVE